MVTGWFRSERRDLLLPSLDKEGWREATWWFACAASFRSARRSVSCACPVPWPQARAALS